MTPTDLLAPTYIHMLKALSGWLDKAAGQLPADQSEALLSARLAPDMFPLSTQVRFACVQALEGMCQVAGEPFPPSADVLRDEGRNADEQPGSLAGTGARIAETIAFVEARSAAPEDGDPDRPIAHTLPAGMIFDFTVEQYARDWALGQFYFHLMITYAILRNQGVDLGKADYVGHLLPYLRPGTMPSQ